MKSMLIGQIPRKQYYLIPSAASAASGSFGYHPWAETRICRKYMENRNCERQDHQVRSVLGRHSGRWNVSPVKRLAVWGLEWWGGRHHVHPRFEQVQVPETPFHSAQSCTYEERHEVPTTQPLPVPAWTPSSVVGLPHSTKAELPRKWMAEKSQLLLAMLWMSWASESFI